MPELEAPASKCQAGGQSKRTWRRSLALVPAARIRTVNGSRGARTTQSRPRRIDADRLTARSADRGSAGREATARRRQQFGPQVRPARLVVKSTPLTGSWIVIRAAVCAALLSTPKRLVVLRTWTVWLRSCGTAARNAGLLVFVRTAVTTGLSWLGNALPAAVQGIDRWRAARHRVDSRLCVVVGLAIASSNARRCSPRSLGAGAWVCGPSTTRGLHPQGAGAATESGIRPLSTLFGLEPANHCRRTTTSPPSTGDIYAQRIRSRAHSRP